MTTNSVKKQFADKIAFLKREIEEKERALKSYELYVQWLPSDCRVKPFTRATARSAENIAVKTLLLGKIAEIGPASSTTLRNAALLHHTGYKGFSLKEVSHFLTRLAEQGLVEQRQRRWRLTPLGEQHISPHGVTA